MFIPPKTPTPDATVDLGHRRIRSIVVVTISGKGLRVYIQGGYGIELKQLPEGNVATNAVTSRLVPAKDIVSGLADPIQIGFYCSHPSVVVVVELDNLPIADRIT